MEIEDIVRALRSDRLRITDHADVEALADRLSFDEIAHSVVHGEILEDYPDDKPYPSCLIYGDTAMHTGTGRPCAQRLGVHGVGPGTATLPRGWKDRLIPIVNENTNGATGWCLECHDIAVAKYVAGREKDLRYIADLWDEDLIDPKIMEQRLQQTPMSDEVRQRVETWMRQDQARYDPGRTRA